MTQNSRPQTVIQVTQNTIIYHPTPTGYPEESRHSHWGENHTQKGKALTKSLPSCFTYIIQVTEGQLSQQERGENPICWTCWPQGSLPYYC